ncbi:unnamed protein product, partial [Ascophyllum nodosum]
MSRTKPAPSSPLHQPYLPVIGSGGLRDEANVVVDLDEEKEMELFENLDSFVDRLVETPQHHSGQAVSEPGTDDAAAATRLVIGADDFSPSDDDERHIFLRQQEIAHFVGPGYLAGFGQPGLMCPSQRTALVDWTCRLHAAASGDGPPLSLHTRFLAVNLIDRFLSTGEGGLVACGTRGGLEVAGAACLGIASKYEDTQAVATSLWGLAEAAPWDMDIYSGGAGVDKVHAARKDIVAMELRVLAALSYRVTVPTALTFLEEFIRRASLLGVLPEGPA